MEEFGLKAPGLNWSNRQDMGMNVYLGLHYCGMLLALRGVCMLYTRIRQDETNKQGL
jgi:hypothetical protein